MLNESLRNRKGQLQKQPNNSGAEVKADSGVAAKFFRKSSSHIIV